jgi:glycosyltransferase 2 family protein
VTPAGTPPAKSRSWIGVAKYLVAFALLALVIWLNWEDKFDKDGLQTAKGLKSLLRQTPDFTLFGLVAMLWLGVLAIQYVRWYGLVRALDLPFTLRSAFRLGMVGTFYNTFLPGAIGGDIVKSIYIAKGHPGRKPAAVATVVADRLLGLFGLLVFGGVIAGIMWAAGDPNITGNPKLKILVVVCFVLATIGVVGYVGIGFLSHHTADRIASRLHRVRKVGPTLAELWFTARQYRARPKAILVGVGLSAVAHTLMLLTFHFAVQVFPPDNPAMLGTLSEHLVLAPIGFIVQAIIPLPGGLGVSELTFGGLYEFIRPGGGNVVGLTGRLALRVIEWVIGGMAYVAYLTMKDELPVRTEETGQVV